MGKRRPSDSLRRRAPRRDPYPRFLIVVEGEVTETKYFQHIRHAEKIPIDLKIVHGSMPKTCVEEAVRLKKEALRSKDPTDHYDEVWCVFDVDEHPKVNEAKQQAQANEISLAISNPCFELWILLHYQEQRKAIHRHEAQSRCKVHTPGYDKDPRCADLMERFDQAHQRAQSLKHWHQTRGTGGGNPSTDAHELVQKIRSYRRT